MALAIGSHDPQRTLERGYVLASTREGEPLLSAEAARGAEELRLRFADGALPARVTER
jgi:exonuclease VII large subunit